MHSTTFYTLLLAASASAQSTVVVLDPFNLGHSTLTIKGENPTATTYEHTCPSDKAGGIGSAISSIAGAASSALSDAGSIASSLARQNTLALTPITAIPTSFPRNRRRDDDNDDSDVCEPYTIIQGPSTWEYKMTDPVPGAWTVNAQCKFGNGGFTSGDATCTISQDGSIVATTATAALTTTAKAADWSSLQAISTMTVVSGSAGSTTTGGAAASGRASGSPTASQSEGFAASLPLPTGLPIALVGGAAGILAAAIAL
ncbi:hypothetical protein K469DRAFT_753874 [Zopfia rhizophila CBS 207.26]|uniref:GPI anchored protein n=1 Tax=Zopfia rhizophila CBS 207.26 TaxID=1314779 RepID=A0A6A6DIY5_9PEZI|nr:hypothetical protein K469DRAFT_753874 [Zopfia rhizophila CBS 207.26]